jgi:ABC-type Na+ transport system ATPase subunit NatA
MENMIQAVINTLEDIEIKATVDNMQKLLACHDVLKKVIESMKEGKDGNADSE